MMTRRTMRAALWGVALGGLAPATTILVLLSGLADDGVTLTSGLQAGFFFVYLPVAMAVIGAFIEDRRELVVAVLVLGVVTLVHLRSYGAAVTDGEFRDAWLTENGSLVLHILVMWALLRWAVADLVRLTPPWTTEPLPDHHLPPTAPRDTATVGLALHAIARGVGIGAMAGGAVGTAIFPLLGTAIGAYLGALYGLVPATIGAVVLAGMVAWRRPASVIELQRTIVATLALTGVATMVWAWLVLGELVGKASFRLPLWLLTLVVVWSMLGAAGRLLTETYVRLLLARRERTLIATP